MHSRSRFIRAFFIALKGGFVMSKFERRRGIESFELRSMEDGSNLIKGYAAEFEKLSVNLGGFREQIRKGAFANSLRDSVVKALWNHNTDMVLGSTKNGTLKLWEDDRGLAFELSLPDTTWGRDALESIRRGDVEGVSFGFQVNVDEWDQSGDEVIRTLVDVELHEISPTPFPAYPQTSVSVRTATEVFDEYKRTALSSQASGGAGQQESKDASIALRSKKLKLLEVM